MNAMKKNKLQKQKKIFLFFLSLLIFINIAAAVILFTKIKTLDSLDSNDTSNSAAILPTSPPKYIFLFIGDGFGFPQMTLASQYKTTVEQQELGNGNLSMLGFDITGIAFTGSANSIIGDSAASATAMSSGLKTYNGYLNYDIEGNVSEAITEKLKKQRGFRIGIISSVNVNHATPAGFYAHQNSRYSEANIFLELLESGFDFFGGGSVLEAGIAEQIAGKTLREMLDESKYLLVNDIESIRGLKNDGSKIIAIAPKLDPYGTIPYAIDNEPDVFTLADFTNKCIELLYNKNGFFIMVEGGKIDWCCHANDAATMMKEVFAFDDAIKKAVEFYEVYPDETLIIVTGDHETGGLSLGFSGTYTSTYIHYLSRQKTSYSKFSQKVYWYRQNQTPFEEVLADISNDFGIARGYDGTTNFYFTEEDVDSLRAAYEQSLTEPSERHFSMTEYVDYGFYDPLTTTITRIINRKAGLNWGTFSHSFSTVPVFAMGRGADLFSGVYHNSQIFHKLKSLLDLK